MKKVLDVLQYIVGDERGYYDEGNIQWYYLMGMVISDLMIWRINDKIAVPFMLLSVLHFATTYIFGSLNWKKEGRACAVVYWFIHLVILVAALCIDSAFAFLSCLFTIWMISVGYFQEMYMKSPKYRSIIIIFHTCVFLTFLVSVFLLPIAWGYKVLMVMFELLLHPAVDALQHNVANVTKVADIAWKRLKEK